MQAHSKQFSVERPVFTLICGLAATIVSISPATAQNPAELIPPAPDTYATGTATNATLGYGPAQQPLMLQNGLQNGTQNSTQIAMGYRVFIPSDNPTIFEQAKAIEPTAFVQTIDGQRVIQVGLFGTEALALEQVGRFQAQGMPVRLQASNQVASAFNPTLNPSPSTIANIAPAPAPTQFSALPPSPAAATWPTATWPAAPSTYAPPAQIVNTVSSGYYVVIPTTNADVNYMQSQLNQLGIPPQYFFLRDRPFGLHYAIGSFSKRSEADRLTTIVRDRTKFDARVYHER